ncbi:unnamed protein product [Macrosiphum euphorbiae]|uniref:Envelope fusion protein n=1 Tax=Macrosiphum euphorbiae TaxID=13131 RepID=A0AAV0XU13_9HEMI|nr:unnamed protein product [Macrosiphum euphorbiae]
MVTSFLVNIIESDEINTSEYFSYTPYGVGRGIQYEGLGPVRLIGAQYNLVMFYSLKEYNTKYELLGEKIKNITNLCTDQKHQDLCGKYQLVITDLYNEITKQKERTYMSLGSTMEDIKNNRKKRGLINIIGNTMHTLFGICDDKCTKKTQEAIQKTEESGTNILHIMTAQTTVVKSTIRSIGNTINQTEQLYNNITEKEQKLNEKMSKIQNKTNDILDLLMKNEIHNLYTIIINQYSYETEILGQIVTAAREGMIHPSLMTPQELASTLKAIEQNIKKIYSIPMGTKRYEINEFQKITKIRIYYSNDRLVFDIVIPLIIDTELTLYRLTPVPMRHNQDNSSGWYMMDITYNNIAVTKGYKRFTTYTDQQLNECKETSIYKICNTPQPIQDNNERQPCEVQNFYKADTYANPELCTVKKINLKRSIYQKLKRKIHGFTQEKRL